ncbi:MAG: Glycine cleavage system H protein [Chlamydiae bacterium]|nr:Glycine cleavage system H protein [Chlamydiota bacterium]
MFKFTMTHEWVRVEGDIATVGVSDWAQGQIGDVAFIDLPKLQTKLKAGALCCILESTKAAADIYSPLSGEVICVNEELAKHPKLINSDAETKGWIFQIKIHNSKELDKLLDPAVYTSFLNINI